MPAAPLVKCDQIKYARFESIENAFLVCRKTAHTQTLQALFQTQRSATRAATTGPGCKNSDDRQDESRIALGIGLRFVASLQDLP